MDIEHFYIEKGQGDLLILLHGNGESSSYFKNQIGVFSEYFRVIAIDTRGHGKTPRGTMPFTIDRFADDLLGFMDAHRIEKAHILGFSDGANIAMIFAMRYPGRTDRLILDGGNLNPGGVKRTTQIPIEIGYRIAKRSAAKSESARRKAEMLGLMVNEPDIKPEELARISAKTLVIAGTRDLIKEDHTRLIAAGIPGSELVFVRGGHAVASKNPDDFNRVVLGFLLS